MSASNPANAGEVRFWNSAATAPWVTLQDRLDRLFAPLLDAGLVLARPALGESVIDVGCGCGASTLALARAVGSAGRVEGIDVSAPMLARAQERVTAEALTQVVLTLADAMTHPLATGGADLVFSRLGVMFFAEPVVAFANLRRTLRPGGRMVLLCVQRVALNNYITTAVQAARPLLPPDAFPVPGPEDPGMFSFGDPARVRRILTAAGFRDIANDPLVLKMHLGGPGQAEDAAEFSSQFGPLPRALQTMEPARRAAIIATIAARYRELETPEGIVLDSAFWIISAAA